MYRRHFIDNEADLRKSVEIIKKSSGWASIDTETTGLHIIKDTPFLLTLTRGEDSFAYDLEKLSPGLIYLVLGALENCEYIFGQNIKFDMHMLFNNGNTFTPKNLADTMTVSRLALDADEVMSLALKSIASKYLYADASADEKIVKSALTALRRERTSRLTALLRTSLKTKKWFDEVTKDTVFEISDLGDFANAYSQFLNENPEPTYRDIYKDPRYKEAMLSYAMNDTELTLGVATKFFPSLLAKDQLATFKMECELIPALFRMERVGLPMDREYLEDSRKSLKKYILYKRDLLAKEFGEYVKVGQHKRIKELFEEKYNISLSATDDSAMTEVGNTASKLIQDLRTLEKWYGTYVIALIEKSDFNGRAYTQMNSDSAKTGRLSSDFQQFPKYAIFDDNGVELFHPRRAVKVPGNGYNSLFYLDYSQIELRVQANYTYDISGGDLNMCRAYMPFKCHSADGKPFLPLENRQDIFSTVWYHDEDNEIWKPVDLHAATAKQAFPNVDPSSAEFKKLRSLGKSTNFAKNYGASKQKLIDSFGFEEDIADALNKGYYEAFPKILDYQKLVSQTYHRRGFVKNRYGRRYYLSNSRFVYKLYNYIIQGTCADMLKRKMIEVDTLLQPYKTKFQMNIHDEMSFEVYDGEEFLIPIIKEIMEEVDWMTVPVVADVEISKTTWADKEDYND